MDDKEYKRLRRNEDIFGVVAITTCLAVLMYCMWMSIA